jgi:hypothetical protein
MLYYRGVEEPPHHKFTLLNQTQMAVTFSRDLMIGMLRKGMTGDQILKILDMITEPQESAENTETVVPA